MTKFFHDLNELRLDVQAIFVAMKRSESGASLVEYSVLLGLLVAGSVATVSLVGTWIGGRWTALNTVIHNTTP